VEAAQVSTASSITVYRSIIVSSVRAIHWQNIGACWADRASAAYPYVSGSEASWGVEVRIRGVVQDAAINWKMTRRSQREWPEGHEINLKPGAVVKITGIEVMPARRYRSGTFVSVPLTRPFYARVGPTADCDRWESCK
jgi:hypothetical protein